MGEFLHGGCQRATYNGNARQNGGMGENKWRGVHSPEITGDIEQRYDRQATDKQV
jgi:hypothetical protein